jgi:cyclase
MIKKRLIPLMLSSGDVLLKGKNFSRHRVVGRMESMLQIWSDQEIDELLLIDIDKTDVKNEAFLEKVEFACSVVNFPLTVGGNIRNIEYARALLRSGADKLAICSEAIENPTFIEFLANEFGSQAVVVIVDYNWVNGKVQIHSNHATKQHSLGINDYVYSLQELGVGEIVLQNFELEGSKKGLDIEILKEIQDTIQVPLILSGGVGNFQHLEDALRHDSVSGVACGSLFYFGDNSPIRARAYLKNAGIPVRQAR